MQTFKSHNEAWSAVRCIMADTDLTERDFLRHELPDASLLVCLYHTLRTFRREVTPEKLSITPAERTLSLPLLEGMASAESAAAYEQLYAQFSASVPGTVREYFDKNWHGVRQEWVACYTLGHDNCMMNANNHLESLNQKLKTVMKQDTTVFYRHLTMCLSSLRVERGHRTLDLCTRVTQVQPDTHPALVAYMALLTPFAYASLASQMDKAGGVQPERAIEAEQQLVVRSAGRELVAGIRHCACGYRAAMDLPCAHVFAARAYYEQDLFAEELCGRRWTVQYYLSIHQAPAASPVESPVAAAAQPVAPAARSLSQAEKYQQASDVAVALAQNLSALDGVDFDHGVAAMSVMADLLVRGRRVIVLEAPTMPAAESRKMSLIVQQHGCHD